MRLPRALCRRIACMTVVVSCQKKIRGRNSCRTTFWWSKFVPVGSPPHVVRSWKCRFEQKRQSDYFNYDRFEELFGLFLSYNKSGLYS